MDDSSIASTSSNITFSSTKIPPKRGTNRHLMGINDKSPPKTKMLFRGFIGGSMFKTQLGYQGQKIDTLWTRQIFDSFKNDDVEIIDVAMNSSMADASAIVMGGEYGSSFHIGDYGFYSLNQFKKQQSILSNNEREISRGQEFLTNSEWEKVDDRLLQWASISKHKVDSACRGDSFASLAVREGAFHVAKKLIGFGCDPLLKNEDGHDVFHLLKTQYQKLTGVLSSINQEKQNASENVILPSVALDIQERETDVMNKLNAQLEFIDVFKEVLKERIDSIKADKIQLQRLRITRKPIPSSLAWNVRQGDVAQAHIDESDELKLLLLHRIQGQEEYNKRHINLAALVMKQHTKAIGGGPSSPSNSISEANSIGMSTITGNNGLEKKSDFESEFDLSEDHSQLLEQTIHAKRGLQKSRERAKKSNSSFMDDDTEIVEEEIDDGTGTGNTKKVFRQVKKITMSGAADGVKGIMSSKKLSNGGSETLMWK